MTNLNQHNVKQSMPGAFRHSLWAILASIQLQHKFVDGNKAKVKLTFM